MHDRITDTSISNLFIIKDKRILTPALSEGCVEGVMRKFLLSQLPGWNYEFTETSLEIDDIITADEVFLTNAIRGIRSVKQFREKTYETLITDEIAHKLREVL